MTKTFKCRHFLHGGDYSFEQWDKAAIINDIKLMDKAHANVLSIGIFAWSNLEKSDGVYDFSMLDFVMDELAKQGKFANLATPSAAPPLWLGKSHPETIAVDFDGVRYLPGQRSRYCANSSIYREKVRQIDEALAQRYANHPALLLWHIGNEYAFHCHCEICRQKFQDYLKEKYHTLADLNQAYWANFWGQTYSDWSEIEVPSRRAPLILEGLRLDYDRFQTESRADFLRMEVAAVRKYSNDIPVTNNTMCSYEELNPWKFMSFIDIASIDSYPKFDHNSDNIQSGVKAAFNFDMHRSFKNGAPFLMMESTPSTCGIDKSRLKRPNIHQLMSLQSIAHGANSVMYFQWKKSRGGVEKFHGAVIDHAVNSESRVFQEVEHTGLLLKQLDEILDSRNSSGAAVIFDWENWWCINHSAGPDGWDHPDFAEHKGRKNYPEECLKHYYEFWRRSISCDVINQEADFSAYKIISAPMLAMVTIETAGRLKNFVKNGGILILTYFSGVMDGTGLCTDCGYPGLLRDLSGIYCEESDILNDDERIRVNFQDKTYYAKVFCDLIHAESAEVLSEYADDFYQGRPALTVNTYGKGRVYYQGCRMESDFLNELYCRIITENQLNLSAANFPTPHGCMVQKRAHNHKHYWFCMNFTGSDAEIGLDRQYREFFSRTPTGKSLKIPPFGVEILTDL